MSTEAHAARTCSVPFWRACRCGRADRRARAGEPAAGDDAASCPSAATSICLSGAGSNIVASVGKDGVLLVDSGTAAMADKLLAAVRELVAQGDGVARTDEVVRRRGAGMPVVEQLGAAADHGRPARAAADHRHRQHERRLRITSAATRCHRPRAAPTASAISTTRRRAPAIVAHENVTLRLTEGRQSGRLACRARPTSAATRS